MYGCYYCNRESSMMRRSCLPQEAFNRSCCGDGRGHPFEGDDDHNIDDFVAILKEVKSIKMTGPVLIHVITMVWQNLTQQQGNSSSQVHQLSLTPHTLQRH